MLLKISSTFLIVLLFTFSSTAQVNRPSLSSLPSTQKPEVEIIYMQEEKPSDAVLVNKINSSQFNKRYCGIAELLEEAKAQTALKGGNALYVTSIQSNGPLANCFSLEGEILKLSGPYSSSPNPLFTTEAHTTTAGDSVVLTEILPVFPGGRDGMLNFLNTTVRYPTAAIKSKISGKVTVSCVLDTTGTLTQISVSEGLHPALDEEAVRIISAMPEWSPGYQNGKAVPIQMTLPVRFTIDAKPAKRKKSK